MTTGRPRERFDELIVPHLDAALTLARWLTGNPSDAEDVVQDACLRAYSAIETCTESKARGWLLTIVRNCAFTWMSRNRPKSLITTSDVDLLATVSHSMPVHNPTPEAELIAKTDAELIHAAIARLPVVFREALVLREFHDLSYSEIADVVRAPVGTVMSRLARARSLLIAEVVQLQQSPSASQGGAS